MTASRTWGLRLIILALGLWLAAIFTAQVRLSLFQGGNFYAGEDIPVGGDFLLFYSAGRIVAKGDGAQLYDAGRQAREQEEILGRSRGLAIFPYPAFVALAYAPASRLSLPVAYLTSLVLMTAAATAIVVLLRRVSPTVNDWPLLVVLAVMASQPFNVALLGGQPVAFTTLCLAGLYVGLREGRPVNAGVWLGLLAYKPQMALVLVPLLVWQRRFAVLGIAAFVTSILVALGAAAAGADWPEKFLSLVTSEYYRANAILTDGILSISIPGLIAHLFGRSGLADAAIAVLCLLVLGLVVRAWRGADPRDRRFPLCFGVAVAATLLVSPHALFYEAGVLVLPIIALIDAWREQGRLRARLPLLAGLFALGSLWPLAQTLGFEPLVLVPIAVLLLTLLEIGASSSEGGGLAGSVRPA